MLLRYPLLRYPNLQIWAFAVPYCHHRATPGLRSSAHAARMTLRLWRAVFVADASVVPLVTVDEGERDPYRDLDNGTSSWRSADADTHPVCHSAQLPADRIPSRPAHQIYDRLPDERVGPDPLRRELLGGAQRGDGLVPMCSLGG
jgi:hypothetical protein